MIFPAGKPKNSGFNSLHDDAKAFTPSAGEMKSGRKKHQFAVAEAMKMKSQSILSKGASVGSARSGVLSDIGGQVRQMGANTCPSIFNPDRLAQIKSEELTQGERIKAENQKVAEKRQELRREVFTIDPNTILAAKQRSNTVQMQSVHANNSTNYSSKVANHQISIFDGADKLEKLSDLTSGEQIKAAAKARREKGKDRSWEHVATPSTAKSKQAAFFESLKKSQNKQGK